MCATVFLALCGMALGYLMGRTIGVRLAASNLIETTDHALADSVAYSKDAHAVLDAMNAASTPFCGKADLEFLSKLFYKSHLLKEIGRVHEGKIQCSTTVGRVQPKGAPWPKPNFIGMDGVKVYTDLPVLRLRYATVTALQKEDSYVVLNPYIFRFRDRTRIHLITTVIDASHMQSSTTAKEDKKPKVPILTRDSDFRIGDVLYSTRCSQLYSTCMTAYLSIPEALQGDQVQISGNVVLGGVAGGLFGFFVALAYRRQRSIEKQLRRAIRQDALTLVYQPILNLVTNKTVGAEALARWTDEDGGVIGPDVFVRAAEEFGFVGELTEWVVRRALRDFRGILLRDPQFHLNLNVTSTDLADDRFLPMLEQCLSKAQVPATSLTIEITEGSTARKQVVIEAIHQLRMRGHSVHIDDFGTGYSSLAYLKDLSVDAIKIDKAFTHAIGTEAVTLGILPQILALANTLHLGVIAEGIETVEQAEYFAGSESPVLGQGWLFGRPVSAQEFQTNLTASEKAKTEVPVPLR